MSKTLMNKSFTKQWLCSLKMHEGSDLQQHVNVFNNIIIDLVRLWVKIDDEDKIIILLFLLPSSYDHLMTTHTYEKDISNLNFITGALLSHSRRRQRVEDGTQGDDMYVKRGQDHGWNKGNWGFGNKRYKSRNHKQLSVIVANSLGIRRWVVQKENMVHWVIQTWFKPTILAVKQICCVFHLTNAHMCRFLTLVVLITWQYIRNGLLHSCNVILNLFIYVMIKHV